MFSGPKGRTLVAALAAAMVALTPRGARAEPDPPLTIAFLDIPDMIFAAGSLTATAVTTVASANEERVDDGWALFGALSGLGACVVGTITALDAHTFTRVVGIVTVSSGVLDIGSLIFNARYGRRLPNQVSVGPRVFTDSAGQRAYGAGISLSTF